MARISLACAILVLLTRSVGASDADASQAKATLEELSFISGCWAGDWKGGLTEEQWSRASGDSMMCVFKYVKGGQAVFYEMLLIEQTKSGPVMRLKHFNPGLIGWEEKDQAYSYPLIELGRMKPSSSGQISLRV